MKRTALKQKALGMQVSISELNTLRSEGLSNREIARRLDVSEATIGKYIPAEHKKYVRLSESQRKELISDFKGGAKMSELAEYYNIAFPTVRRILIEAGEFTPRPYGGKGKKLKDTPVKDPVVEPVQPKPAQIVPTEDPGKESCRLIHDQIAVYNGRRGRYLIDKKDLMVLPPELPHWFTKDELGELIRDLMIVWQEV